MPKKLTILFCLLSLFTFSQNKILTSEKALDRYKQIRDSMELAFPSDEVATYRRYSFNEEQLRTYLSQLYEGNGLLEQIDNQNQVKLEFYLHAGNWFRKTGFLKESIKSYQQFFDYYDAHESELTNLQKENYIEMRFYAYSILSEGYSLLKDFENAAKFHRANIIFSKPYTSKIYYPSALNNYGLHFYWYRNQQDSALHYFNKAHAITQNNFKNHKLIGSIRDNIADIMLEKGKIEDAEKLYAENFVFYRYSTKEKTGEKDIARLISAGAQLIKSNLLIGNISKADKEYGVLDSIVNSEKSKNELQTNSWIEFLTAQKQLLFEQQKFKEAYEIANNLKELTDSIQEVENQTDAKWRDELNSTIVERIALDNRIRNMKKETELENQRTTSLFFALIATILLLVLFSLFFSRRQHLVNAKNKQLLAEQTLENTKLKLDQLHTEIISKERDLSDFALNLSQNQEWAQQLVQKIQNINTADPTKSKSQLNDLEVDIKNKVAFDSNTKDFFYRLEKLSNGFYNKLTDTFPNLSKNEIRLCSLIRLKIDSRNIANLQNITLASLNTSRYRLRKKLELSEDTDLDDFIQNL